MLKICLFLILALYSGFTLSSTKVKISDVATSESYQNKNSELQIFIDIFNANVKYDDYFKIWSNKYPSSSPSILKALAVAESKLNPLAISSENARGLTQIIPSTWKFIKKAIPNLPNDSIGNPSSSINATAYYLNSIFSYWSNLKNKDNRLKIVLASYNAGIGNIIKANKLSGCSNDYNSLISHLHKVTGTKNSEQTKTYVNKVLYILNQTKK